MSESFKEVEIPATRKAIVDLLDQGLKCHFTPAFIEIDITKARQLLKERKKTNSERVSFLSWIIKCIAKSVENNKQMHALRNKRNKLILFDDVDISVAIERKNPGKEKETLAMPYIVRSANQKSMVEIFKEIQAAQNEEISSDDVKLGPDKRTDESKLFLSLPKFLRNLIFWNKLGTDAFLVKKKIGTVLVSSVGMHLRTNDYFWGITRNIYPLSFLLTGLVKKPAVVDDKIVIREFLCATIGFQHDVIDGAPFTRYITQVKKIIENAEGL